MRDERRSLHRCASAIFAALALFLSCEAIEDWSRHEEFEKSLRCGMSAAQVRELATRFGADFKTPTLAGQSGAPNHYVQKRWRVIGLWFENDRLRRFESGLASPSNSEDDSEVVKVDLCNQWAPFHPLRPHPSSLTSAPDPRPSAASETRAAAPGSRSRSPGPPGISASSGSRAAVSSRRLRRRRAG